MARVIVAEPQQARETAMPEGITGQGIIRTAIESGRFALELHRLALSGGEEIAIGPRGVDTVLYVVSGEIHAGGRTLAKGSSLIVEHGAQASVQGTGTKEACLLVFSGDRPGSATGGAVHLLPRSHVPSAERMSAQSDTGGAIHADSACPTCEVWLHENHFSGTEPPSPEEAAKGIHSHSEDEIIVVLEGSMRLGSRLVGQGTALAVAADTLYAFTPGPDGLGFINFRAHRPGDIRFASGETMSETGLWRALLPRPEYLAPVA